MTSTTNAYQVYLQQMFEDPTLAYALATAADHHRHIEVDFSRQMLAVSPQLELAFPNVELSPFEYLQRNLFSIFLLSILQSLSIADNRLHHYGVIMHAVRGVVTATDNILDDESKGTVRLTMGQAHVVPNLMLALLQDGVIHRALADLEPDSAMRQRAWHTLMEAVLAILQEESSEEPGVSVTLQPEALLQDIHSQRGGGLFQLALTIPEVYEPQLATRIAQAKEGVFWFGLTIQVLDDIADLAEDVQARNHNLLQSWIVHRGLDGPMTEATLRTLDAAALCVPERTFPESTRAVLAFAIDAGRKSFRALQEAGYPISPAASNRMLGLLFQLRGLERLWGLYAHTSAGVATAS